MATGSTGRKKPTKKAAPAKKTGKKIVDRSIKHVLPKPGLKGLRSKIKLIKPEVPTSFMARRIINITWQGRKVEAIEGRFAYSFRSPTRLDTSDAEKIINFGVSHSSEIDPSGVGIFQAEPGVNIGRAIKAAQRHLPDLQWLEPVTLHRGCSIPNDTHFIDQWGLKKINAERAWDIWGGNPNSVVLAILDTGIPLEANSLSHPDLNNPSRFFLGSDLINGDDDPADDHGHGTHVTGVAAANLNNGTGIAGLWPGLTFIIKVSDSERLGSDENFKKGVIQAVNFASQRAARLVINYSSAGSDTTLLRSAIEIALSSGALIVASVGNHFGGDIAFPAAYAAQFTNVIAVGAVDEAMARPEFANRGTEMTVVAPGVNIFSTTPNYHVTINNQGARPKYEFLHGTSQAAPLVSALAALVWSKWPQLSAQQVRNKIASSAIPISGSALDFGRGIINAERALT